MSEHVRRGTATEEHQSEQQRLGSVGKSQKPSARRRSLTYKHLNALAVVIVFSVTGMVSIEDFAFVIFSLIYVHFLSKFVFPLLTPSPEPPTLGVSNKLLGIYVSISALIGIFLPIAYILEGILEGDQEGIKAAVSLVFLLCSQIFMEGLTFTDRFSIPIRVFVPVFYNTRRIFTLVDWLKSEIGGSTRRLYVGRGLAVANLVFWCFNLFGLLLPVFLPRVFKSYYGYKVKP
ncbi:PREDICTED: uncharacterized protein LOC104586367 [Nelumbo nucifera]|uniref:DUF7733 domain-containing protein n=2 Tax=Nelumbo nucifera TaxID=4432 RepID=A0A822ZR47_NELNU|nr:PREDICTED: uncharacterized protein LOC104586367 [Nelumbo nucifera]DAD47343.1 TPA_asm: hypothetical protein HUJ06_017280 [Nelumbo nucifera]